MIALQIIKTYWSQILVFVLTGITCWQLHGCSVDRLESKHQNTLSNLEQQQKEEIIKVRTASAQECFDANKISEEIINENQTKMSNLQRELAVAKRMQTTRTIYITTGASDISQSSPGTDATDSFRPGKGYAVDSFTLLDHAGRSKEEIIKYESLQTYVRSLEPFIARCEGRK